MRCRLKHGTASCYGARSTRSGIRVHCPFRSLRSPKLKPFRHPTRRHQRQPRTPHKRMAPRQPKTQVERAQVRRARLSPQRHRPPWACQPRGLSDGSTVLPACDSLACQCHSIAIAGVLAAVWELNFVKFLAPPEWSGKKLCFFFCGLLQFRVIVTAARFAPLSSRPMPAALEPHAKSQAPRCGVVVPPCYGRRVGASRGFGYWHG